MPERSVYLGAKRCYINTLPFLPSLLAAVASNKTLVTPVDSLATGFDLEAYRRWQQWIAAVQGTNTWSQDTVFTWP